MSHPVTRRVAAIALFTYLTVFLLTIAVHAVALFALWKWPWPSYDWGPLADRFVTSPAMAGLFAVFAAVIGAWSLNRQLKHTKQKAEDEAWWEQFEWVTDRIVSPNLDASEKASKTKDPLPFSMAISLIRSLKSTARAPFQKDAVDGILNHYLKGSPQKDTPLPEQDETAPVDESSMDAAGVESLRALFAEFPSDEKSSQVVRAWDRHFEYENDVLAALRHRFGPLASKPGSDFGADAVMTIGSHKLVVEVKQLVPNQHILDRQAKRLRMVMDREGAHSAVIITPSPSLGSLANPVVSAHLDKLSKEGIHLVEWSPSEKSGALRDRILATLPEANNR
ncbi:hypothetical protein HMI59_25205 (plasmid) [Paenarthrobacter sp. YJN-5]|nr:hypothetical protein HMI59_25205 [Paenarthrobacter sp. YJN-5]